MSEIRDYQVDHLLLLVGSNPLPNAVAGKLLTATGGQITLFHSHDSYHVAQKLIPWFRKEGYSNIEPIEIKEADAASVYNGVTDVLKVHEKLEKSANGTSKTRVGLNYTAGTKVMSVQAHQALKDWAKSHDRDAIFSYLDAHTLQMCFDPAPGRETISFYIGQEVNISIYELLELHNWELKDPPITEPVLPLSAKTLLAVYSNPIEAKIWTQWLHDELFKKAKKPKALKQPYTVFEADTGKELKQQLRMIQPELNNEWKKEADLQALAIPWPKNLPELYTTMRAELKQDDIENLTLKNAGDWTKPKDFCKWLSGIWLEYAVLNIVRNCSELQSEHCCMNLKVQVPDSSEKGELFEFDVVATRGYQLFAFSCSTDSTKGLLKLKLFEACVRAQQMGGDEACIALVCCASKEDTDELEKDIRHSFGFRSRIRVFGSADLVNLAAHIENWVREQSKER